MPNILLFLRVFMIGICALAMVAQTRLVLGIPFSIGLLEGFIFGGSLFGYHCTHPNWRYRAAAWVGGVVGGLCFLFWVSSITDFITAIVPMLFWLAYYGFRRPGKAGLRSSLWAKPLTVALAWAWVTVALPLHMDTWLLAWPIFLTRAAFIFILALAYDLSDLAYDRRTGLTTLAMRLEERGTFLLIYQGLGAAALIVGIAWATGVYSISVAIALQVSLLASAWWLQFLAKKESWHPWHKVLIDALMLFQCSLVLLLR